MASDLSMLIKIPLYLFGVILFLFYVYLKTWSSKYWKRRNANSLTPIFPSGNMSIKYSLGENLKHIYDKMKLKNWKHGGAYIAALPIYVIVDLECVKKIFSSDFEQHHSRGIYLNEELEPYLNNFTILDGGETWKKMRTIFVSTLTTSKLKIVVNLFLQHLQDFEKVLENRVKEVTVLRIDEMTDSFFVDFLCDYVIGIKANVSDTPEHNLFKKYVSEGFEIRGLQLVKVFLTLALPHDFLRQMGVKMFPSHATEYYINTVSKIVKMREKGEIFRQDFIQLMLEAKKSTDLSFEDVIRQIGAFYVASLETTSATTVAAFLELALHPDIQDKVRAEITAVLKKRGEKLRYEALNDFTYLNQVICETLRKYPPSPQYFRKLHSNFKIDNVELEKDTYIFVPTLGFQHDEEYFPDPDKFDPDRFTSENIEKRPKLSYIPFGAGPRMCPGKFLAEIQLKFLLATFVMKYKFTLNSKSKNIRFDPFMPTIKFNKGVWLNVQKIEGQHDFF